MNKCPKCGSELLWIWGVDHKTNKSDAFAECRNNCGWHSEYVTIGAALNGLQSELAAANQRIAELEAGRDTDDILIVDTIANTIGQESWHDEYLERRKQGGDTLSKMVAHFLIEKLITKKTQDWRNQPVSYMFKKGSGCARQLNNAGIKTVGQFADTPDVILLNLRNWGKWKLADVRKRQKAFITMCELGKGGENNV